MLPSHFICIVYINTNFVLIFLSLMNRHYRLKYMWYRCTFVGICILSCCFLLFYRHNCSSSNTTSLVYESSTKKPICHNVIILAKRPSIKVFETKQTKSMKIIIFKNFLYQLFVGHMFNLTMFSYDHSNMNVHISALTEEDINKSLANGKEIFHPVKHNSRLLINATRY